MFWYTNKRYPTLFWFNNTDLKFLFSVKINFILNVVISTTAVYICIKIYIYVI